MSKSKYWIAGTLFAFITGFIPFIMLLSGVTVNINDSRNIITNLLSEKLGRAVHLKGPIQLELSFHPAVHIEQVVLANPEGWPGKNMATIDKLSAQLSLLPIFKNQFYIRQMRLDGFRLKLERLKEGTTNWQFSGRALSKTDAPKKNSDNEKMTAEPVSPPYSDFSPQQPFDPEQTQVFWKGIKYSLVIENSLEIRDFIIQYEDHPSGAVVDWQIAMFNAHMPDLEVMEIHAKGRMLNEPYRLDSNWQITNLLSGSMGDISAHIQVADLNLDVMGRIDPSATSISTLRLICQVPDSDILERLLGEQTRSMAPLTLTAGLEVLPGKLDIPSFKLETAHSRLEGSLNIDNRQVKSIQGKMAMDHFDVSPWLTPSKVQLENRKQQPEPQIAGSEKKNTARKRPPLAQIADHWLSMADIDVHFSLGEILGSGYEMSDLNFSLKVEDGTLSTPVSAVIEDIGFQGTVTGQVEDEHLSLKMKLMALKSSMDKLIQNIPFMEGAKGEFGETHLTIETQGNDFRKLVGQALLKFNLKDSKLILPNGNLLEINEALITGKTTEKLQMRLNGLLVDIPVVIFAKTTAPSQFLLGRPWQFSLNLDSTPFTLDLKGMLPNGKWQQGWAVDLFAKSEDLGSLSPWLGVRRDAKGKFEVEGRLEHSGKILTMDLSKVTLAGSSGRLFLQGRQKGGAGQSPLQVDANIHMLDLSDILALWPKQEEPDKGTDPVKQTSSEKVKSKEKLKVLREWQQAQIEARLSIPILPKGFSLADSDLNLRADQVMINGYLFENLYFNGMVRDGWLKKSPFSVRFAPVDVQGDFSLDLRTSPYLLDFFVETEDIDLGALLTRLNIIENGSIHLDKADFSLSLSGYSTGSLIENARLTARLGSGYWDITDENTGVTGRISLQGGSLLASPGQPLSLEIGGQLKNLPLSLKLSSLPLDKFIRQPSFLPLDLALSLANVSLVAKARARRPFILRRTRLDISLKAPRLNALDSLHGLSLPPYGPLHLSGNFRAIKKGYKLNQMKMLIGNSELLGNAVFQTNKERPALDLALQATNIQMDDFRLRGWNGWSEPVDNDTDTMKKESKKSKILKSGADDKTKKSIPLLSPRTLERLDAKFTLDVDQVRSGEDWLGAGKLHWQLKDRQLHLDPLSLKLPGGDIQLSAGLLPSEHGFSCYLKAEIEKFDYGILARHIKPDTKMQGLFSLHADLKSQTKQPKDILKNASGTLGFGVWPSKFEAGILDLWAVSLVTAVLPEIDKNNRSVLNCSVGIFRAENGILNQDLLLADTSRMRVIGQSEVNFNTETIHLRLIPKAKRAQIFGLATPIQVSGNFEDFKIGVARGGLIGTTVRFVTSPVIAPLRWILEAPLEKDGSSLCHQVWDQGFTRKIVRSQKVRGYEKKY